MKRIADVFYERVTPDEVLKRMASERIGQGIAERLYPKAKFRPEQYKDGGADFTLPGGRSYLEAKCAAVGKKVKLTAPQRAHLAARGSRLIVSIYNRQAAAMKPPDEDGWELQIARALTAIIDVPGPWAVERFEVEGRGLDTEWYMKCEDFIRAAAQSTACGQILSRIDFRAGDVRVRRHALPFYAVGRSPHMQVATARAARDTRMGRGASEEAPF